MEVRNRDALLKMTRRNPNLRKIMDRWIALAEQAYWSNIQDVRRVFPTADALDGGETCFNIGGGNYRLIVNVVYSRQMVFIRELLTHAEYTRKYVR